MQHSALKRKNKYGEEHYDVCVRDLLKGISHDALNLSADEIKIAAIFLLICKDWAGIKW